MTDNPDAIPSWYRDNSPVYESLGGVVATTISALLKSEKLAYLAVSSRIKTLESIVEKVERKNYQSVQEITDIVGARIITYIESDVAKVCKLIELAFKIHPEKSVDKSKELQSNEIGYRSVHYICELGPERIALPELKQYQGILFEVQVRTVLQHAWAEIEHDRSYKFAGELPAEIKRRLNLLAGTLEIVDGQFDSLAKEVDEHEKASKRLAESGVLRGVELTSAGVVELLRSMPDILHLDGFVASRDAFPSDAIEELRAFGIETLEEFKQLLTPDFLESYQLHYENRWVGGTVFVRAALTFSDVDRYFKRIKKREWTGISPRMAALLDARYGVKKIDEILKAEKLARVSSKGPIRRMRPPPPPPEKKI